MGDQWPPKSDDGKKHETCLACDMTRTNPAVGSRTTPLVILGTAKG